MHRAGVVLLIGAIAVAVACTPTVADEAVEVCQPLCRCNDVPLPAEQHDCVTGCIARFEQHPLDAACVTCVIEHATRCTNLVDDCRPACHQAAPLQPLSPEPETAR